MRAHDDTTNRYDAFVTTGSWELEENYATAQCDMCGLYIDIEEAEYDGLDVLCIDCAEKED